VIKYEPLTEKNWLLYAARNYNNPGCVDTKEFMEDLKRIKYVKKACTRYETTGELKERLILNHIVILNNVFGPEALPRILYLKMERQMKYIKPFMIFLNIWPDIIWNVGKEGQSFYTDVIPMDHRIIEALRTI
jgi:hypothetical protein